MGEWKHVAVYMLRWTVVVLVDSGKLEAGKAIVVVRKRYGVARDFLVGGTRYFFGASLLRTTGVRVGKPFAWHSWAATMYVIIDEGCGPKGETWQQRADTRLYNELNTACLPFTLLIHQSTTQPPTESKQTIHKFTITTTIKVCQAFNKPTLEEKSTKKHR